MGVRQEASPKSPQPRPQGPQPSRPRVKGIALDGMQALLFAAALAIAALPAGAKPASSCKTSKVFAGAAPSAIVQQQFAEHFEQPLNRVDCRDNGLCYQTWGKDCQRASQ